jgi:hypothetical protein
MRCRSFRGCSRCSFCSPGHEAGPPARGADAADALPGAFLRFIGVAEVLGALGLILPGLLGIRPGLTPLAAAGLVIIMTGATVLTVASGELALALIPLVVGLLSAFVAYGRWRLAPHRGSTRPGVLHSEPSGLADNRAGTPSARHG